MALTYEEIGIDGPTASPKSDLRVPATWDQFVDPAAQTGQSIVFFFDQSWLFQGVIYYLSYEAFP